MLRKLILTISFLSIAIILMGYTGCWNLGSFITVDNSANVGQYTSMKISSIPSWNVPYQVDSPGSYYCTLALDNNGDLNVGYYRGGLLYYAKYSGSSWSISSVFSDGRYVSVAVDSSNNPYFASYNGKLIFSYTTGASVWVSETVDNVGNVGSRNSLVMESNGTPHISYRYVDSSWLKYAKKVANLWQIEVVDTTAIVNQATSLALDTGLVPHIAYYDDSTKTLQYATRGVNWNIETVDPTPFTGRFATLLIDSQNIPNIVYSDYSSNIIKFARKIGVNWSIETVDPNSSGYNDGNIAYSSRIGLVLVNNNPIITYPDSSTQNIKVAIKSGGNWKIETVQADGNTNFVTALGIDSIGNQHIAYIDHSNSQLKYLAKVKNTIHVAYYDVTNQDLKHATRSGQFLWSYELVDTTGNSGANTSIALDTSGFPHISFERNAELWFASRTSGFWVTESIDSINSFGQAFAGNELAIGTNNIPQIAYYNRVPFNMYYAIKSTNTWVTHVIDTINNSGQYPTLALDANNKPHIAYGKPSPSNLGTYYATLNGSSWTVEVVDTTASKQPFYYNSISVDKMGNPFINFFSNTDETLYLAHKNNNQWVTESIDTGLTFSAGANSSILFDEWNAPHITYYRSSDTALFHAHLIEKVGRKWYIDCPTEIGLGGTYNSLVLQDGYIPNVSYYYVAETSLSFNSRAPTFYTLPDIKVLNGHSISSAFDLDDYSINSVGSWTFYPYTFQLFGDPLVVRSSINAGNIVSYSTTTIDGFTADTVWYADNDDINATNYWSQFKQSNFLLNKLPKVIAEGTTFIENVNIDLSDYLSQSNSYSGDTYWNVSESAVVKDDTTKIDAIVLPNTSNLILGNLTNPLTDRLDLTIRVSSDLSGTDWDKEVVRIYPILNNYSGFTSAIDSTQWGYELPPSISQFPIITWAPGLAPGGGFGNLAINFNAANQGVKMTQTMSNWIQTEPNQWYMVRALIKADTTTVVPNTVNINVFAFNGVPALGGTDIGAQVTLSATTVWTWYEVPILSSGTSMYPQLLIKNGSTSNARILVNKVEIIKAKPDTELAYGTPKIAASGTKWNSSSDLNKWAFEQAPGVGGLPSYSVNSGLFNVSFAGDMNRGLKMTASSSPGVVITYPNTPGEYAGMSMKVTSSGTLTNPVVLLAIFGTDSVNSPTIKDIGAFANLFRIVTNKQNVIRMAYPATQPYGYQQIQLKNAGNGYIYLDDIYQETESDIDNYWDNTLFPE